MLFGVLFRMNFGAHLGVHFGYIFECVLGYISGTFLALFYLGPLVGRWIHEYIGR